MWIVMDVLVRYFPEPWSVGAASTVPFSQRYHLQSKRVWVVQREQMYLQNLTWNSVRLYVPS